MIFMYFHMFYMGMAMNTELKNSVNLCIKYKRLNVARLVDLVSLGTPLYIKLVGYFHH